MRLIIALLIILLSINAVLAQNATNATTTIPGIASLKAFYNFLVTANPVVLLILGGVLVIVSQFAKWVGIIMIIIAIIHLIFWFVK